jgi:MOSC domain-containing protein YiiM
MIVRHIYISPAHNYFGHYGATPAENPAIELPEIECVADRGLRGDRFFDYKENYKGQVTFFAWEVYEAICSHFDIEKPPSVFRRNVITQGIDLNQLIGAEFEINDVHFYGVEECRPCTWMDEAFAPGTERFLRGRGGLRALILRSGVLRANTFPALT